MQGALAAKLAELTAALEGARCEAAQAKEQAAKDLAAAKAEMDKLLDQRTQRAAKVSSGWWVVGVGGAAQQQPTPVTQLAAAFLLRASSFVIPTAAAAAHLPVRAQELDEIKLRTKAEVSGEKEARAAVEAKLADAGTEIETVRPCCASGGDA